MFKKIQPNSASERYLKKSLRYKADFDTLLTKREIGERIPTFYPNPEKYWGPGSKAVANKKVKRESRKTNFKPIEMPTKET